MAFCWLPLATGFYPHKNNGLSGSQPKGVLATAVSKDGAKGYFRSRSGKLHYFGAKEKRLKTPNSASFLAEIAV
jgi:hypothetical protein